MMENLKKVSRAQWCLFALLIGFAFLMQNCQDDDAVIYEENQTETELNAKPPVGNKVDVCRYNERKGTYSVVSLIAKFIPDKLQPGDVIIDADGDGYVNANECGVVGDGIDCDDTNPEITRITSYQDADEDGYGNPLQESIDCTIPSGYVANNLDCDDNNIAINPGAEEICGDGIDNNCDGEIDEDCISGRTYVPDDNFEQALIDLGYDDTIDNYVDTENINTVTFLTYITWKDINNLRGIGGFTALKVLECYGNNLSSLDLSKNTELVQINCGVNVLTSINVSSNLSLEILSCFNNKLEILDLNENTNLTELECSENKLKNLDVSNNTALIYLWCNDNPYLSCIQVNSAQYASIPSGWYKDAAAIYSLDCSSY